MGFTENTAEAEQVLSPAAAELMAPDALTSVFGEVVVGVGAVVLDEAVEAEPVVTASLTAEEKTADITSLGADGFTPETRRNYHDDFTAWITPRLGAITEMVCEFTGGGIHHDEVDELRQAVLIGLYDSFVRNQGYLSPRLLDIISSRRMIDQLRTEFPGRRLILRLRQDADDLKLANSNSTPAELERELAVRYTKTAPADIQKAVRLSQGYGGLSRTISLEELAGKPENPGGDKTMLVADPRTTESEAGVLGIRLLLEELFDIVDWGSTSRKERYTSVCQLYYVDGMKQKAIGKALRVTESRVCQILGEVCGILRRAARNLDYTMEDLEELIGGTG